MVKNITLSAEEALIRKARERAARQKTSLNVAFRQWLERYTGCDGAAGGYEELMRRLRHVRAGGPYGRDEMHER